VFDADALTELAADAGLARDEVRQVLAGDAYSTDVEADLAEARAFGATGVPFFVFAQRYRLSGAHPVETFRAALSRAWSEMHAFERGP
jgi:predicted DsbA family dithiol-disulfide isomerase